MLQHEDKKRARFAFIASFRVLRWSVGLTAALAYSVLVFAEAEPVSFSRDVAPILLQNCQSCHGPKKEEGGYRVDTYERAFAEGDTGMAGFVAGDLEESEAFRRIVSDDTIERMPLDGDALAKDEIALLKRWIEGGAKFDGDDLSLDLAALVARAPQPDPPESYSHPVPITALRFSDDGSELFAAGYYEVTVWDPATGELTRRIKNIAQRTMALHFSPAGKLLAVAGGAPGRMGTVRIVDPQSGELKDVVGVGDDLVLDVSYSPDGHRIAASSVGSGLQVFDAKSGELQLKIDRHSDWVTGVAWSPDSMKLATASRDKSCKVFDATTGELSTTYTGHGGAVRGIVFHPEGSEVFSCGSANKVYRWKLADAKTTGEVRFEHEVLKLIVSDGFVFAASADKTVRQVDIKTTKEVRQFKGIADWPVSIDVHSATKRVAAGGYDGEVRVWDFESAELLLLFPAAPGYVSAQGAN